MSIVSEVNRLKDAKTAIKTAIEGKGVTVPDATMLDGMAALIDSIEAGGGGVQFIYGTYIPSSDEKASYGGSFSAEFGFIPDLFVMAGTNCDHTKKNSALMLIFRKNAFIPNIDTNYFVSATSAPTEGSQMGTSYHRYFGALDILKESGVTFFGSVNSLLLAGVEYFWVAVKFT